MSVVEKQVASTLANGTLRHDPLRTTGADITGALAMSTRMGSLLWRVKLGNDRGSLVPLEICLARAITRGPENRSVLRRVAAQAIREYVDARCKPCGGRGTAIDRFNHVTRACYHCSGSGIGSIDDRVRIQKIGCTEHAYDKKWRARFAEAYNLLQESDTETGQTVRSQLRNDES